jgi:guanylate kinase
MADGKATGGIRLIVLCSPSGAGKTTLAHRLLSDPSAPGLRFSVSHTTRPPRRGERHGTDYHFVDEATFLSIAGRDGFAEHAVVHGNMYGTSIEEIERIAGMEGTTGIVFDIDVQGAAQLAARYPGALRIFILPPSLVELERRLAGRGSESAQTMQVRLRNAVDEIRRYEEFDYIVVNDDLDRAFGELVAVVKAHGLERRFGAAAAEALLAEWEGRR